jgi:L-ribulose-5-phosphate 3-epimerase
MNNIGFIQGRLLPLVDGKIQAFPWDLWREEFKIASDQNYKLIEWTLDKDRLYENPIMLKAGQDEILGLCRKYSISIPSLTADCFMQAPFWKVSGAKKEEYENDFLAVAEACSVLKIKMIVVPLVDNSSIEEKSEEEVFISFMKQHSDFFSKLNLQILFESDFNPTKLKKFIGNFDSKVFGVNYDIGNSAALGFNPISEFNAYGDRILNIHVKDRKLGGTTVPLGTGDANFDQVFVKLSQVKYKGNYILQTARASNNNHVQALNNYRNMTKDWIANNAA